MKTTEQMISIVEKKLKEHKLIVEQISDDLKDMKKDGKIETAHKSMILKDRVMFHKAVILVLQDIKNEIQG